MKNANLKLVCDAYSSIKVSQLSVMLGVGEEEAVAVSDRVGPGQGGGGRDASQLQAQQVAERFFSYFALRLV